MSRPLVSHTRRQRLYISQLETSTPFSRAQRSSGACRRRMFTAFLVAQSASGHGASDRSMLRINGRIRSVSSKRGRSIQDNSPQITHISYCKSGVWSRSRGILIVSSRCYSMRCTEPESTSIAFSAKTILSHVICGSLAKLSPGFKAFLIKLKPICLFFHNPFPPER